MDCMKQVRDNFLSADVFAYVQNNGVALETFYPKSNLNKDGCRRQYEDKRGRIKIQSHKMLWPNSEQNLKAAVAVLGPISVNIKVTDNFFFYDTGVFYDYACLEDGSYANHAVLLVGYGNDSFVGPFWLIKNSWGVHWGENGFARIARDTLVNCELPSAPFYPIFSE